MSYSELKQAFQNQLQIKSDKDFQTEWERVSNLEMVIIKKYGFDGIKLVLQKEDIGEELYQLNEAPADCPWFHLCDLNPREIIKKVFKEVEKKLTVMLFYFKERCSQILALKLENKWYLLYYFEIKLHDGRNYFRIFAGGEPNYHPEITGIAKTKNWILPDDLKEFYSLHDGFGEFNGGRYIWWAGCVMPSYRLNDLGELMNPIAEEQNFYPPYVFDDLLEFFPDGAGNCQCFYRKNINETNPPTVDWDHETREISFPVGFYEFLNEQFSVLDEE